MVDWDLAVSTATRLISPGPEVSRSEAEPPCGRCAGSVEVAAAHVERITGLHPVGPIPVTRVVDRPGWVRVNADGMARLLTPLVQTLEERRPRPAGRFEQTVGPKATGVQAGTVLAYLSGRVLGQYEVFPTDPGQLLLVAPNIVEVERRLEADPRDFRLWVCLHEVTHRTQFTAVPWLRAHFLAEVPAFVEAGGATRRRSPSGSGRPSARSPTRSATRESRTSRARPGADPGASGPCSTGSPR